MTIHEAIETILALFLVFSPLYVPVLCFLFQVFVCRRRPPLLLLLPVLTGLPAFGWFPEHWNSFYRGFYVLNAFGAFLGSMAGGVVCAVIHWRQWFNRQKGGSQHECGKHHQ